MKKRHGKISIFTLCIVSILTIILMTIVLSVRVQAKAPYYEEKLSASERTARAFSTIKNAVDSLHIPIDRINDPNQTGLIGLQFSPLTIERGDITVKLTATNPNIAAMVVHLLKRAQINAGDTVAVYLTGSTPALNTAAIIALETVGAIPIIIASIGSSMWGANYPELTILDIERILWGNDIISSRTAFASIGGHDETGRGFSPEGRTLIDSCLVRNGIPLLKVNDINDAIDKYVDVYTTDQNIHAFISISEQPSGVSGFDHPPGIIFSNRIKEGPGLIPYFSRNGIPVIHLTQIHQLAMEYGLPIAPVPLPGVGEGKLYHEYRNSVVLAVIFLLLLCVVLFFMLRYDLDALLRRRGI